MTKRYVKNLLCLLFLSISAMLFSQNVGINTSGATPSVNAILDLNTGGSNNLGLIVPNVTLGASLATFNPPIANAATAGDVGMLVFNSSAAHQPIGYYYWSGAAWVLASAGANNGLTLNGSNIQLGGALTAATAITQAGFGLTITGGAINLNNATAFTTNIGNGTNALTENGNYSLNSSNGAATTSIAAGTTTGTVGIANGTTGGNIITIGNTNGATSLAENVGTGNYTLNGAASSTYTIGAATTTGTYTLGGATQTGAIAIGQSTATNTINIGNAATTGGNTQTINIGNGSAAGTTGDALVNIGDTNGASTTTINSGSGATIIKVSNSAAHGGVAISTSGVLPNAAAALDIESTTKGLLLPQMNTTEMNAIAAGSPPAGLVIYNTTTGCIELYSNGVWNETGCPCTAPPAEPGAITGSTNPCASSSGQIYSISAIFGAFLYNWSIPPGATITSGTNTTSITITFGTTSGNLSVSATNSCGSSLAYSEAITLIATPSVTVQPSNTSVCTTGTAVFSITATGALLTYQWYESTFGSGSWHSITNGTFGGVTYSGATSNSLSVATPTAAMNGNQYYCIVSGECTPTASSNTVTMTVNSLPAITVQPINATAACNNAVATFSLTATGAGLTYQWYESINSGASWSTLTNSSPFSGVTTATLTLTNPGTALSGTEYECIVSGTCAPSVTSNAVTLTVNAAPVITIQPTATASACPGVAATYTIGATGTGLTYQWEQYITGWNPLSNGGGVYAGVTTTTMTLTPTVSMNAYQYECVVSGTGGCSATTSAVTLSVEQPCVPITLTNSAGTATSANCQVMITVNSSTYNAYESSGLQNVEFSASAGGGSPLYAWIESGATNTSTSTVYWVNLGSNTIAASGGTLTIYMNFMSSPAMTGTTGYTGEAPEVTAGWYATTYAQYDNGALVFPLYYDNFAGTTVNAEYTQVTNSGNCTITPNNGMTLATNATQPGYGGLILTAGVSNSPVQVFDADVTNILAGSIAVGIALANAALQNSALVVYNYWHGNGPNTGSMSGGLGGSNAPNVTYITTGIEGGAILAANTQIWYNNYVSTPGVETFALPATVYPSMGEYNNTHGSSITYQWARCRQYPPSGTMPTAAFGAYETCP